MGVEGLMLLVESTGCPLMCNTTHKREESVVHGVLTTRAVQFKNSPTHLSHNALITNTYMFANSIHTP